MSGLIPNSKQGDCSLCSSENVQCRKRGKELICLSCCKKIDTRKQLIKAQERSKVRSLGVRYSAPIEAELDDKVLKEKWFQSVRPKLTGTCQCGCGNPSSKKDYKDLDGKVASHFRSSICHIFPKRDFHSVKYHPLNYVERAFWGGCHSNMDNLSLNRWVNFADWDDIKAKFHVLAPLLTEQEKSLKFYTQLEILVYRSDTIDIANQCLDELHKLKP